MKAVVNQAGCIGCGLCVGTCPDIFHFNQNDKAEASDTPIPEQQTAKAQQARDDCPVHVIDIR